MIGFLSFGKCRFCNEQVGRLRREHTDCRARHDETERELQNLFAKALTDGFTAKELRTEATAKAAKGFNATFGIA